MTIVELIIEWPMWLKIISGLIFFVWLIETLLLPFKINVYINSIKRVEGLLEQIKGRIDVNKSIDEDYQKMMSLIKTLLSTKKEDNKR